MLVGNDAAAFLLVLEPGAVREPHWHPNAWELDVPLSGRGRLGLANPDDTFAGMPTHTFTDTFGLPEGALATADKPDETLFIVEPARPRRKGR